MTITRNVRIVWSVTFVLMADLLGADQLDRDAGVARLRLHRDAAEVLGEILRCCLRQEFEDGLPLLHDLGGSHVPGGPLPYHPNCVEAA